MCDFSEIELDLSFEAIKYNFVIQQPRSLGETLLKFEHSFQIANTLKLSYTP